MVLGAAISIRGDLCVFFRLGCIALGIQTSASSRFKAVLSHEPLILSLKGPYFD